MFARIAEAYRRTRKKNDLLWNRFVARPLAAVLLVPLENTSITPNQVTLATLAVFAAAAAVIALSPSWTGLLVGVALLEFAYVLDCVDGQLARLRGTSTPIGAHLDFLMDELKAFLLVAAVGVRLWRGDGEGRWLLEGLIALVAVSSAISLTTFLRRPEYAAATGAAVNHGLGDYGDGFSAPAGPTRLSPKRAIEALGSFIVHYPSYIVFVALANRIDLFLHAYLLVNAAHVGRSLLGITWKLGRNPAKVVKPKVVKRHEQNRAVGMKAIIVAAGRGRRLGPETAEIPKCMVQVAGKPILHRQLEALVAAGVTDIVVVRGYLGDRIDPGAFPVRFIENPDWANNNILNSLAFAASEMDQGFVFSYSDIVFAPAYAGEVAQSPADVALVIDRLWRDTYVGRVQHPISEAELASVRPGTGGAATVDRVGKTVVAPEAAVGEFIGLAKFSAAGAAALKRVWTEAEAGGLERPFGRAARLRQAYLSDALNALADRGTSLTPIFIDGRWREIDTEEDLSRAHLAVADW